MSTPMSLMYANVALEVNYTFNYTSKYIIMGQELNGIICTFPSGVCCILWQMFSMFCKSPHFWYIFPRLLHVVLTSPPPHMTLSTWWYYSRCYMPSPRFWDSHIDDSWWNDSYTTIGMKSVIFFIAHFWAVRWFIYFIPVRSEERRVGKECA